MANIKVAELRTGKTGKEDIKNRKDTETKLKGDTKISKTAPKGLSENGAKIYKDIINLLPDSFLNGGDTYVVGIVADALDRMQTSMMVLNSDGLFDAEGREKDATKTYERYSKIFDKFASKLGLSPKDRAALAVLNIKEDAEKEDPLLKILGGD